MIPPHLPPPTCDIRNHKKWQRLKLLLAAAMFGLVAGGSGAAMMLGWIWPSVGEGDTWATARYRISLSRGQLEERVRDEMRSRIVGVYQEASSLGGVSYLKSSAKLGDALVASSDGWLVMYLARVEGNYKNWRALTADGAVYKIAQIIADPYSRLLYLKLAIPEQSAAGNGAEQFKVISFADKIDLLDDVFAYQDSNWHRSFVEYRRPLQSGTAHLDSAPVFAYALSGPARTGAVVVNNQGRVVGLMIDEQTLLPSSAITHILPAVLSKLAVTYPSLGIEGWFDDEQPIIVRGGRKTGFLVNRVLKKSPLKRGDFILEINGQVMDWDGLWYNINNKTVHLKVWRNNQLLELETPTVAI